MNVHLTEYMNKSCQRIDRIKKTQLQGFNDLQIVFTRGECPDRGEEKPVY